MSATPAAEPITSSDPPVPAHSAISCHSWLSGGTAARSYMPIVAATKGTLSMSADASPIAPATAPALGTADDSAVARSVSSPAASSAPTASRMPRKNIVASMSILRSASDTRG